MSDLPWWAPACPPSPAHSFHSLSCTLRPSSCSSGEQPVCVRACVCVRALMRNPGGVCVWAAPVYKTSLAT